MCRCVGAGAPAAAHPLDGEQFMQPVASRAVVAPWNGLNLSMASQTVHYWCRTLRDSKGAVIAHGLELVALAKSACAML